MKRSAPLRRRGLLRGKSIRVRGVTTDFTRWNLLRVRVYERDDGRCVCCGQALPLGWFECHHRVLRAQRGQDTMDNLITLHPHHHDRWHRERHQARARGYILHPTTDPATAPISHWRLGWVLLTADGGYELVDRPEESA